MNTIKCEGFQAGAVDYIIKPFQAEKLPARVRNHLHLRELKMVELKERIRELDKWIGEGLQ